MHIDRFHRARIALLLSLLLAGCSGLPEASRPQIPAGELREATVASLQQAMDDGELTAAALTRYYMDEIARIDRAGPMLNAIIELNPDAPAIAAALDDERALNGPRGPLHGIPVVLKANIDTGDAMATSAGSLALAGHRAPDDAHLVAALRQAGAVILAKANLSEWANFRSSRSSSGWSSVGGQTRNPYDPDRNPCGSSSGPAVAVAANLTVLAVGTETDGSIVCPAGANGIVGIKPTLGLVSRDGIIPIAHSQDTAGPMARTVRDAAILLDALAARDANDPAMAGRPPGNLTYAARLDAASLASKRIGVLRNHYGAGSHPGVERILAESIATLTTNGAVIVDPVELDVEGAGETESIVLYHEFKVDLAAYLEDSGAAYTSLAQLIRYNEAHADTVMPWFGQERFLEAQSTGGLDTQKYREALENGRRIMREAINGALAEHGLDAILAPTNGPAWMTDLVNGDSFHVSSSSYAAVAGYPNVTVPAGFVHGLPVGLSFFGGAWDDQALIAIAHAFEQALQARKPPRL